MKVLDAILGKLRAGKVHMTLVDPADQKPEEAGETAFQATLSGTDAVMVGGSTGVTPDAVDATCLAIKRRTRLPVILFPGGAAALSRHADALYFMSLLNSRNVRWLVGEQRRATLLIKKWGLEAIPMGYVIVAPGMRAGEVGEAAVVSREDPREAVEYGLLAEYLGMRLVYLEAGSGAPDPVPPAIIRAVREAVAIPVIAGGGIRTPEAARAAAAAGADIVVTGTVLEESKDPALLGRIVDAVKLG
jgi:phosphoglycerol geranylgeranyltransferase